MQDDDASRRKNRSLAERVAGRMAEVNGLSADKKPGAEFSPPPARPAPIVAPAQPDPVAAQSVSRPAPPPPPKVPVSAPPVADEPPPAPPPLPAVEADTAAGNQGIMHINFTRLQNAGFVTPQSPRSGNTEEFRVIKRQILKTAFTEGRTRRGKNSNIIMVTSSIPGEGKTFTSLNLAMSFSMERDLYVLLVDADNHRHSLSTMLDTDQADVGLVDLLVDPSLQMRDIIRRTELPTLSFIAAGRPHPQGTELMASKLMATLMEDLAMRYPDRLIIIDTPPLLASTEGVILSSHVGHAIVVVEKHRTPKRSLRRTLEMLEGCSNISCVLNMETAEQRFAEYAYGY